MVRVQQRGMPRRAVLRRARGPRRGTFVPLSPYPRSLRTAAGLAVLALFGLSLTFIDAVVVSSPASAAITYGPAPSSATLFPTDSGTCDATGVVTNNATNANMALHTATYSPASSTPEPANPCRFAIEWRNTQYGPSGAGIMRRTLFWVYATAGQYIVTGSSELFTQMAGTNYSDIVIWNPDGGDFAAPSNLDGVSNTTLDSEVDWRCSTATSAGGRSASTPSNGVPQADRGVISNRAQELAGAGSVDNSTPGGYAPCYYQAPTTGFYAVAFYGPQGANTSVDPGDANGSGIIGAVDGQVQALPTTTTVNAPAGAAHDSDGNVYIANTGANNILKITPDGTISVYATTTANGVSLNAPSAIALTGSGNSVVLYVVNSGTTGNNPNQIIRIPATGNRTSFFTGSGQTVLNAAQDITTDGTYLYVANTGNATNANASIVRVLIATPGTGTNFVNRTVLGAVPATGIAYDASHTPRLILTLGTSNGIRAVTMAGGTGSVSTPTTTGVTWNNPTGVETDASGNVYVANTGANAIVKLTYSTAGAFTPNANLASGSPINGAKDLVINTDGYPYIANTSGNNILRIGPTTWSQVTAGNATRSWDIEVRDTASSTQSVAGRVFTYALAAITDGNPKPVDITYWVTTRDGYRYRVTTNGFDPNGFVLFGNNQGFLNSDGTQLDHDILGGPINGTNLQEINNPQGGTTVQPPTYTIGFDGALDPTVETLLSIPVETVNPSLIPGSLSYDGQVIDDQSYSGQGGTFHVAAAALGEVQIVVSYDANNYDPTNPRNATIRYTVQSNQVTTDPSHPVDIPISWNGMANDGTPFPPFSAANPYHTLATLQGGPYHLPMIDVESQAFGSPTITLENPPDGQCPVYRLPDTTPDPSGPSCTKAFFNDMGYTTAAGTKVGRGFGTTSASTGDAATNFATNDTSYICTTSTGTNGATLGTEWSYGLAPDSDWTPQYQSDPYYGFDSDADRLVRAFGSSGTHNNNYPCNSSNPSSGNGSTLGDAAGLDLWTFYPSLVLQANVVVIQAPLAAVSDGTYRLTVSDAQATNGSPVAVSGCGTNNTSMPSVSTPATGGANTCLLSNDTYPGDGDSTNQPVDPGQSGAHVQCLVATNAAGTAFGTSGSIYDGSGNAVGTITITGTPNGSDPCAYTYSFNGSVGAGSYYATYQLSDSLAGNGGQSATALISWGIGGVAVDDTATTKTAGTAISGNVTSNDLCMADSTNTVNWVNTKTASVSPTTFSYSPWVSLPGASPDLAPDLSAIGTITPGDNASDYDDSTTTTAGSDVNLVNVNGAWSYTPSSTYSGVFSRTYRVNVNPGTYIVDTSNNTIRQVTSGGVVTTFAGSGTAGDGDSTVLYDAPAGVVTDSSGNVYVADTDNDEIKKITPAGVVTVFATGFNGPTGLAIDTSGNLYVSDTGNHLVKKVTPSGTVSTIGGNGTSGYRNDTSSPYNSDRFSSPRGIAVDSSGNVYVADSNVIRMITPAGAVSTLAGPNPGGNPYPVAATGTTDNATSTSVRFNAPGGLAIDPTGTYLYVADTANSRIRRVTLSSGATTTFAGPTGAVSTGSSDGTGSAATFNAPQDLAIDSGGNLYVADTGNSRIRKITSGAVVTTWAGPNTGTLTTGDRDGTGAGTAGSNPLFNGPQAITVDGSGNVYLADTANNKIRKATSAAVVTTFSGPPAGTTTSGDSTQPSFDAPSAAVLDSQGNLFVTDSGNNKIKKITSAGVVTVFAGPAIGSTASGTTDGTGTAARFDDPTGIAIDAFDNLYVVDTGNNRIRKITPAGVVSTLAGSTSGYLDGTGSGARFSAPGGIVLASDGNLYVADTGNNSIRQVTPLAGIVTTLAGDLSSGDKDSSAYPLYDAPAGAVTDSSGNVYIADTANDEIKKITPAGVVTVFATGFSGPTGLAIDSSGNLYVSDTGNHLIRKVTSAGAVSTLAGSGTSGYRNATGTTARFSSPRGIAVDSSGNVYVADSNVIRKITSAGVVTTLAGPAAGGYPYNVGTTGTTDSNTSTSVRFNASGGLAIDSTGTYLYVADTGNSRIRRVTLSSGATTTFAGPNTGTLSTGYRDGTGAGTTASYPQFNAPQDLAIDSGGNLYVADTGNSRIRKITPGAVVTTWAGPNTGTLTTGDRDGTGAGTAGSNPLFNGPQAIAVDGSGNVYLADTANNKIRKVTSAGVVTTFSGPPAGTTTSGDVSVLSGLFNGPVGIAEDGGGNLYVADTGNNKIRQLVIATGVVTTPWGPAAGTTTAGNTNSATPTSVRFRAPQGITIDPASGAVYVADTGNSAIRLLPTSGSSSTLAGSTANPGSTGNVDATGTAARFNLPAGVTFNANGSCDNPVATLRITVTPVAVADNETPAAANAVQSCSVTWTDHPGDLDWTPANYVSTGATDYAPTGECNPLANDHGRDSTGSQIDTALLDYTLSFGPGQTSFTNNCTGGSYPTSTVGCFTMASDGTWTFTPPTDWSGAVRVNYGATGAGGDSSRSIMTLHVVPLAVDDSVTGTTGDTVAGHPASALAGDVIAGTISSGSGTGGTDSGTGLTFVSWGTHTVTPGGDSSVTPAGALSLNGDGTYSYTPDDGWWGTISVPYTIQDSTVQTATATLTITVTPLVTIGIEKMGISASEWVDMSGSEWAVYTDPSLSPGSQIAAGDLASISTGRWTVSWLHADADYWIVETKAMTGFELLAGPVQFHLAADGTVSLASGATTCPASNDLSVSVVACIVPADDPDPARIVIRDMTSVVLPKAGGTGTEGFVWTGLALVTAAGLIGLTLLALRRRRTGRHARYQDLI